MSREWVTAKPAIRVALDIGSAKVACVIARVLGEDWQIIGSGIARYPSTMTSWPCDIALMAQTIEQAVEAASCGETLHEVLAVVSHPQLSHTRVTAQVDLAQEPVAIRARDIERTRAQALAQSLGIDQDALAVTVLGCSGNGFDDVPNPRGLTATRLRATFHVVAMPLSLRRSVVRACDQAGLEVTRFLYSLPATARACIAPSVRGRMLIIDVGGAQVDAGVFVDQRLVASTTIPWGGHIVAHAIASEARLTAAQALAASLEGLSSSNLSVQKIFEEQLPSVREGIEEMLDGQPKPDAAIITGGGALIDVGGVQVDAGVFVEHRLIASTTIPWGGHIVAHAIASEVRLTSAQALTASLEGLSSSNPSVRKIFEAQLPSVREGIERMLEGQPKPDAAIITGGGALIDGLAEWCEQQLGINCRLGRSPRLHQQGELWNQLALGAAVGALEMTTGSAPTPAPRTPRGRFNRLLATAHSVLNDYF